jgi:hypothetical protein
VGGAPVEARDRAASLVTEAGGVAVANGRAAAAGGVGFNDVPQPFAVEKNVCIVPSLLRVVDKLSLLLRQFFLKQRQL